MERLRPVALAARTQLLVLGAFAALAVGMTWPLAAHLPTHTIDVGVDDPLLYARLLDHFLAWLAGHRPGLMDANFFWPHPGALTTHDVSLGILYGALPFRPFTGNLLALVNLGVILSFALTGHATWLLARAMTGSARAGWIAGAAFSFCLFRLHQADHLNVLQMQWGVYALYALTVLRRRPGLATATGLALALFLHGSAGMNVALYSVFALALFGLYVLCSREEASRGPFLAWAAAACVAAGVLLAPIYGPYLAAQRRTDMVRGEGEVQAYSGNIVQLAAAPRYSRVYGTDLSVNLANESLTFPGWTVLAFALLGTWLPLSAARGLRGAGLAAASMLALGGLGWMGLHERSVALGTVVLLAGASAMAAWRGRAREGLVALLWSVALLYLYASLGPTVLFREARLGPGIWGWLTAVPGYASVRTPARLIFESSFALALLAGLGLEALGAVLPRRGAAFSVSLAAVLAVLYEFHAAPLPLRKMPTLAEAPPVYAWLAEQPGTGAVLELPAFHVYERQRMLHATLHGRPTVDAESGFRLGVMQWFGPDAFRAGEALRHLERMRGAGLEFVVLHLDQAQGMAPRYRELLQLAGGEIVQRYPRKEVWRMPRAASAVPLSPESAAAALVPVEGAAGAWSFAFQLGARGAQHVFEYRHRTLTLRVKESPSLRADIPLSPPLLAPGQVEAVGVRLATDGPPLPSPCTLEVVDESGRTYATRPCPGLKVEAPCAIEQVGSGAPEGTVHPLALSLSAPSSQGELLLSAWGIDASAPLLDIRVPMPADGGGRLAGVPLRLHDGSPVRFTLRAPGSDAPLCEATLQVAAAPAP